MIESLKENIPLGRSRFRHLVCCCEKSHGFDYSRVVFEDGSNCVEDGLLVDPVELQLFSTSNFHNVVDVKKLFGENGYADDRNA